MALWRQLLKALIQQIHPALDDLQPNAVFRLVDEQRIPSAKLDQANGLAADIIRVEQANDPREICNVLLKMYEDSSLGNSEMQLAAITEWLFQKIHAIAPDWQTAEESVMTLVEMIRKNVIPYIEQRREEGIKEGREEGMREGRKEEKASAIAILRNQLRTLLTTRFGSYPKTWEDMLEKVNDTSAIGTLLGMVYQVASAAEYEPALRAAAGE